LLVTSDFLAGLMTNFQAIFRDAYTKAIDKATYVPLCLLVESKSAKESYNWLEAVPAMREWVDERAVFGLSAQTYEVQNLEFEATIGVDKNTLSDEKYDQIAPRVRQLAIRAANHPQKRVFELLNAGASTVTYDGVNFFASSGRAFGDSGSIVNIAAGAYAADGDKIRAGIGAAVKLMRTFKDNRGEYLNLVPDTVICSPVMEVAIRSALLPGVAGVTRPEADIIRRIIVTPYLTSGATAGHDYIVASTEDVLKPMLIQYREKPTFTALDDPKSVDFFMKKLIYYGTSYRGNVALLEPRCAVLVDCSD
jgi:phage major head subunit gpT-like protein